MNPNVEKILKLPLYQRLLLLVAVLLLLVAVFVFLLYLPKQEEYGQLQDQQQSLQTKLQQDQRIADNLPKFKAEYEKMQEQLSQALTELPNEKEIPTLLTNISSLAKEQGLDVLRFKPTSEVPRGFFAEVPVQLKLSGSFHDVAAFFYAVGNLPRIVNISSLNLADARTADGRTVLSVDCLATTFRFLETAPNEEKKGS